MAVELFGTAVGVVLKLLGPAGLVATGVITAALAANIVSKFDTAVTKCEEAYDSISFL